jgi:hypothetical protein
MMAIESPNVREINATPTQMLEHAGEVRLLEASELDAVNGGIIPVLVGIGVGIMLFEVGMIVGMGAANYKYTGSVWGR